MVSPYHWVSSGFDVLGTPPLNTDQFINVDIPAGATLKRILVANCGVHMFQSGLDHTFISTMYCSMDVRFVGGVWDGHVLWRGEREVPLTPGWPAPEGVTAYTAYWAAADLELGWERTASFSIGEAADANVNMTTALVVDSGLSGTPAGDWHMNMYCLYKL